MGKPVQQQRTLKEGFSSRTGLVLAALGMAIGAGNLWRFPRVAATWGSAEHGAGAFIIAWLICLVFWSIPIMIAEFTLGKATRRGPVGAYASLLGTPAAWMGAFMAFTTLMIACYYSVVSGWTLKYLLEAVRGFPTIGAANTPEGIRAGYHAGLAHFNELGGSREALLYHLGLVLIALFIIYRGVRSGVEILCKLLIPLLFLLLLAGVIWIFTTDPAGALKGFVYLFDPNYKDLARSRLWIDALSQSAWSTGAGWGLLLTYGSYARKTEDAVVTNTTAALGNNLASILVGCFLFPAMFSLLGAAHLNDAGIRQALSSSTDAGTGMVFQYIPFIFKSSPDYGYWLTLVFFAALFIAALSSLIAMYELGCRVVEDMGASRHRAALCVALFVGLLGTPAALSMKVFISMDWSFGVGLILSGLMVVWAVQLYGVDRFRRKLVNESGAVWHLGFVFNWFFLFLVPAQGLVLLIWWLKEASTNPDYYGSQNPWDPFALGTFNAGTCVWWWAAILLTFMLASPQLGRLSQRGRKQDKAP